MSKQSFKLLWRIFLWILITLLFITNSYIIAGHTLGKIVVNQDFTPADSSTGITIFILSNGIHTDILVPSKTEQIDWTQQFPPDTFHPPKENPEYISFGWGEQNLYDKVPTWDKFSTRIFLYAMAVPTKSSMHVTYRQRPLQPSENVKEVIISPKQYETLVQEIIASITLDSSGNPIEQNCCWYPAVSDNFYDSPQRYHLFQTCNHWTITMLKRTGLPAPLWTPFPEDIMAHLSPISE